MEKCLAILTRPRDPELKNSFSKVTSSRQQSGDFSRSLDLSPNEAISVNKDYGVNVTLCRVVVPASVQRSFSISMNHLLRDLGASHAARVVSFKFQHKAIDVDMDVLRAALNTLWKSIDAITDDDKGKDHLTPGSVITLAKKDKALQTVVEKYHSHVRPGSRGATLPVTTSLMMFGQH